MMRNGCTWAGDRKQEWCRINCCKQREIVRIKDKEIIVRADESDNILKQFNVGKAIENCVRNSRWCESKCQFHQLLIRFN
jgi:hypothetical protein